MVKISCSQLILIFAASTFDLMVSLKACLLFLTVLIDTINQTQHTSIPQPWWPHNVLPCSKVILRGAKVLIREKNRCSGLLKSLSTEIQGETENYFSPQTTRQS